MIESAADWDIMQSVCVGSNATSYITVWCLFLGRSSGTMYVLAAFQVCSQVAASGCGGRLPGGVSPGGLFVSDMRGDLDADSEMPQIEESLTVYRE